MMTFVMYRRDAGATAETHDENTINPPGEVQFEGVVFSDGTCAIRWRTAMKSTSVWSSFAEMMAVHGHPEYGSELRWVGVAESLLRMKADANVAKWGAQDASTLIHCLTEELGELAQAYLQWRWEDGQKKRMYDETIDLGALVLQLLESLKEEPVLENEATV
jgi:NTP pyrophosphatase (non-canonical NTP hydrolase)